MKSRLLMTAFGLLLTGSLAMAAYQTDFSTDKSGDFTGTSGTQIGRIGNYILPDPGNHMAVDWTGGQVNIEARYARIYTQGLTVTGDSNDGYYAGDVATYLEFDINSTLGNNTDSVRAMLSIAQSKLTTNTYPVYFVDANGGTLSIIKKWSYDNVTEQATIATSSYATTTPSETFRLEFSAIANGANAFGTIVDLSAAFYHGSTQLAAISATDTPTGTTSETKSYTEGYVAWGVGQSGNDGTFTNADVVGFGVNVPEPATMGLLAFGALAMLRRRK